MAFRRVASGENPSSTSEEARIRGIRIQRILDGAFKSSRHELETPEWMSVSDIATGIYRSKSKHSTPAIIEAAERSILHFCHKLHLQLYIPDNYNPQFIVNLGQLLEAADLGQMARYINDMWHRIEAADRKREMTAAENLVDDLQTQLGEYERHEISTALHRLAELSAELEALGVTSEADHDLERMSYEFRIERLQAIADNLAQSALRPPADLREFDVFICHASEDKDEVVRPLAEALRARDIEVWYDEFELRIGDSLRRKIDAGIARSRFGIVVLSRSFFAKGWSQYELDGLVTMAVSGKQVLLPLWHGISSNEVADKSPSLADKVAIRTADRTIGEIAAEITSVVR